MSGLPTIHPEHEPIAGVGNRSEQDSLTQPGGSVSSGAHLSNVPLSQGFDVTHRGLAEEAAVFTIELADTFVSDLKGS